MPLLRKKVFEKHVEPEYLRDDDEVFHCEITNEIFKDYHDFSERMFLCNSMVWTCSMTGKSNLTYQEALESEEQAIQCLKVFPSELKVPILYLATLTKRTSFGEMAEDIFTYTKDRYFVGENVEACFTPEKWKECHVISVIAPNEKDYKHEIKQLGDKSPQDRIFIPSSGLYKYEVECSRTVGCEVSEIMIVDSNQVRRKRSQYSREKAKLFLKQNVEQDKRGIFVIKPRVLEQYKVNNVMWDTIFDGPPPNFQSSKNFEKALNGKKKQRQETLANYLQKNGLVMKKEGQVNKDKEKKNGQGGGKLLESMRKREEEFKRLKQLNDEQKALRKQKEKEEKLMVEKYIRDWYKPKEDLELENHQKLPVPTPVQCKVPNKYFGDMISILEFVHQFTKLLSTKDFFPGGFTLEILERSLTEKEVAGPLTDLIQMLLVAIFNCQEEESNSYNTRTEELEDMKEKNISTTYSVEQGTHLATLASKWPIKYQGLPIARLPLYSLTVSEVLRLHLLASGARIKDHGARWRYQERGGYTNEDDPGLYMRLHQTHILKALAIHNVVQLSINDKIKIITCLMHQILSYADVRDIIEESLEKARAAKLKLRSLRAEERRNETEFTTERAKLKKQLGQEPEKLDMALKKLEVHTEKLRKATQDKIADTEKSLTVGQSFLGRDRAYRKYIKLESVPGLFVNWDDELGGACQEKITVQYPGLFEPDRTELSKHIKRLCLGEIKNEPSSSLSVKTEPMENTQEPQKLNGSLINKSSPHDDMEVCQELLLCTTDPDTCPVHSYSHNSSKWAFFHNKEQIGSLVAALNSRGYREGELKEIMKLEEPELENLVARTPVALLNPTIEVKKEEKPFGRLNGSTKKKDRYEDANLGYPPETSCAEVLENALIENILEMEDKIHGGALGELKIKDRDKWRNCLQNKNYDEFETIPIEMDNKHLKIKKDEERSRSNTPEIPDKEDEYQDPGKFLGATTTNVLELDESDWEFDDMVLHQAEDTKKAIKCLANALCHVAKAVDPKHLKRPLGHTDVKANNKQKEPYDRLDKWVQSLLASTSFSQVLLHYGTLDSCVMWSRSALLARCQVCRRAKDSENMLLCDGCNLGHHMYCLKPKLTAVPKGDWFCDKCKKEKVKKELLLSPQPVKRRRRIFVEEEVDEEEEHDSGNEDGAEEEQSGTSEGISESEDYDREDLCKTCGSGGDMVKCEKCDASYHKECVEPPLRRLPRSPWSCPSCSNKKRKHPEPNSRHQHEENGFDTEGANINVIGLSYTQRRCAAKASRKIHAFARLLRDTNSRSPNYNENDSDIEDEVVNKRPHRRDEQRDDLPLHNAALHELLSDVMKHEAAWPFLRPVQPKEVPDYYEIIKEPMDFGTIKNKLNMGNYNSDGQVMRDIGLIFENCNTYNSSEDEVYRCGVQLSSFLCRKATELGFSVPPGLLNEDDDMDALHTAKKKRIK